LGFIIKIFALFKGQRIIKTCKIEAPAIILTNHTSFYDFLYTAAAMYPNRVTYLAARKMFFEPGTGFFLRLARAIPKSLMQADSTATIKSLRILKKKGIISIFPEGQISPSGRSLTPAFSIAKLIKKSKVNVYMVKHFGAGLVNPPWSKKSFKGRIETVKELIISKEELVDMDLETIYKVVCDKLYYSASEDNLKKQYKYKLNDIANLENVIYQCPSCGHEGLVAEKVQLRCPKCNIILKYDEYGLLNGLGIDQLFMKQEESVRKQIDEDENYQISGKTRLMTFKDQALVEVGSGTLTIKNFEYVYQGTMLGETKEFIFMAKNIPSLPSDIGRNVQIYEGDVIYQFEMDVKWLPTKMVHVGEYLYHLKNQ
jgi:1-acyl-sn-glycerol-3-phosphate acyltransferase